MTIKKYYQNGELASIGFDSLEEIFAYRNTSYLLEDIPSNELKLNSEAKEIIHKDPKFKEFVKLMMEDNNESWYDNQQTNKPANYSKEPEGDET